MKRILIFVLVVIGTVFGSSTNILAQADRPQRLNVYIVNFYSMPILLQPCDFNSNYVRVNPLYRIDIKEKNIIYDFQKVLSYDKNWSVCDRKDQFTCRVVFDFIENDNIVQTLSFDESGRMTIDGFDIIYRRDEFIIDKIEKLFPIFVNFFD